jgi:FkbM family methyltransferase
MSEWQMYPKTMFKAFRERVKRIPLIGPRLYRIYLAMFFGDGKVFQIRSGPLVGKRWIRFFRIHNDEYVEGTYESAVQNALTQTLRPGAVFYDVGANGGFFSLLAASVVGPRGKVVSFEPHPETARLLARQMYINGMQQVDVVIAAVSNEVGMAQFDDDTVSVMAGLTDIHPNSSSRFKIWVKTTTIDEEVQKRAPPDVIKIDVEGAELRVLQGAQRLLHEKRPVLLVELHSPELAMEYDHFMSNLGYETCSLTGKKISAAASGERFVLSRHAQPVTAP